MLQVYNPLQQGNVALQGSVPTLQGSTQTLQGPTQAPTFVGPVQPQVASAKRVTRSTVRAVPAAQAVQPVQQPQVFSFDSGQQVQFDPSSGQQTVLQPQPKPAPAPVDPNQELAQYAGAAGVDPTGLAKLIGLTPEDRQGIYNNLGVDALAQQTFALPTKSTQQIYNDAYSAAGLADIKSKFQALQDQINKKNEDLTAAIGKVNENPWLAEANRIGRAKNLQELANSEINNLVNQAQQYADLYNQGIEEVHNVVTNTTTDFTNNQQLNALKLQYLQQQAEKQISDAQDSKIARYLPDYLKAKAGATKPEVIGTAETGFYRWNPATSKFEQVTQPQAKTPASYQEYQLAMADPMYNAYLTADANRKAVRISSGGASGLPNTVLTKVQTIANQFDNEQIVKDFNVIAGKYNSVKQIINSGVGGPGDLAVVYEFMKGLDPTSVVRESEYASAAKSGNIFSGVMAKFNGYLNPKGGFLPPEVKSSFLSILNNKLGVVQQQYDNVYSEYGRRIDKMTGQGDGTEYITNYGKAFQQSQSNVNLNDLF